jgi:hypothetical protein
MLRPMSFFRRLFRTPAFWVFAAVLGVWLGGFATFQVKYAGDHPADGTYKPSRQRGDGHYFYLYTLSMALDLDVEFEDEMLRFGDPFGSRQNRTPTGRPHISPVGSAIMQVPLLWVAQGMAGIANVFGARIAMHGYTPFHGNVVFGGNLLVGIAALWFAYRLARRHTSETAALYGVAAVGLGTGIFFYAAYYACYNHTWSIFWAAWLVEYWDRTRGRQDLRRYAALGALSGALALVRQQDAIFAVVPVVEAAVTFGERLRRGHFLPAAKIAGYGLVAAVCGSLVVLPELLVIHHYNGNWFGLASGEQQLRFDSPFWSESLWSSRAGLFVWTPIAALAFLGLVIGPWRRARGTLVGLLGFFAAAAYANGATWVWDGGFGFANRRMLAVTVLLVPGLAFLVDRLRQVNLRWPRLAPHLALLSIAGPLLAINLEVAGQISRGSASKVVHNTPINSSQLYAGSLDRMMTWLFQRIGAPTAFPANLVWSLRTGAPIERYERVVGRERHQFHPADYRKPGLRLTDEITVSVAELLVGDWSPASKEGDQELRRSGKRSTLLVPIHVGEDLSLEVEVRGERLAVEVNGWKVDRSLPGGFTMQPLKPPEGTLRAGTNVVTFTAPVDFKRVLVIYQP